MDSVTDKTTWWFSTSFLKNDFSLTKKTAFILGFATMHFFFRLSSWIWEGFINAGVAEFSLPLGGTCVARFSPDSDNMLKGQTGQEEAERQGEGVQPNVLTSMWCRHAKAHSHTQDLGRCISSLEMPAALTDSEALPSAASPSEDGMHMRKKGDRKQMRT